MLAIVKNYQGDVLDSINEINASRFAQIQATDPQWLYTLGSYFAPNRDGSAGAPNGIGGSKRRQLLLPIAASQQGTGQLRGDVDIQPMSHTLLHRQQCWGAAGFRRG